jgi:tetratricopeptide (TPR) repeat protein
MPKLRILRILALLALVLVPTRGTSAGEPRARKNWIALQSPNFYLMGDVGESDLRRVARRLEQFREAIGIAFPKAVQRISTPTTVIVFKSHKSYDPVKPLYQGKPKAIAGYFLPGQALNYVTLTTEDGFEDLGIVYHEYLHLLINNNVANVPLWFNEGLAEFYRTFEVSTSGDRALIGKIPTWHVVLLRQQFVPLETLVTVDRQSPLYNEGEKASVFYAESWALVHYLLLSNQQKLSTHTADLLNALLDGVPFSVACQRTLGMNSAALQQEIRKYVNRELFQIQQWKFTERIGTIDHLATNAVPEAEVHATLGDLLRQMGRADDARAELSMAVSLDPSNGPAHASLGMLAAAAQRWDEAIPHFKQAVASPSASYLCHYYYATSLARSSESAEGAANLETITTSLRRAIELNPGYADSYVQLAWHLSRSDHGAVESVQLLRKALELAPGREDYVYGLATMMANAQDYQHAKQLLEPLASRAADNEIRRLASDLLGRIVDFEKRRDAWQSARAADAPGPREIPAADASSPGPRRYRLALRSLKTGEQRVFGRLSSIDCKRDGILFVASVDQGAVRTRVARFEDVDFISYRDDLKGQISCGSRSPGEPVYLTFQPSSSSGILGKTVAIEFLPDDYQP